MNTALTDEKPRLSTQLNFKELNMDKSQIARRNSSNGHEGIPTQILTPSENLQNGSAGSTFCIKYVRHICVLNTIRYFCYTFHLVAVLFHLSIIHCFFIMYLWYHYVGWIMFDVILTLSVQEIISRLYLDFWK